MRRLTPELTRRIFSVIAGTRKAGESSGCPFVSVARSVPRSLQARRHRPLPTGVRVQALLTRVRRLPRSWLPNVLNEISRCASSSQSE